MSFSSGRFIVAIFFCHLVIFVDVDLTGFVHYNKYADALSAIKSIKNAHESQIKADFSLRIIKECIVRSKDKGKKHSLSYTRTRTRDRSRSPSIDFGSSRRKKSQCRSRSRSRSHCRSRSQRRSRSRSRPRSPIPYTPIYHPNLSTSPCNSDAGYAHSQVNASFHDENNNYNGRPNLPFYNTYPPIQNMYPTFHGNMSFEIPHSSPSHLHSSPYYHATQATQSQLIMPHIMQPTPNHLNGTSSISLPLSLKVPLPTLYNYNHLEKKHVTSLHYNESTDTITSYTELEEYVIEPAPTQNLYPQLQIPTTISQPILLQQASIPSSANDFNQKMSQIAYLAELNNAIKAAEASFT